MPRIRQPNRAPPDGSVIPKDVAGGGLLPVPDFARAIRRPERAAYDMIADGRVRAVEIGAHRVAVPESEVRRFPNNPCCKPHWRASASSDSRETVAT